MGEGSEGEWISEGGTLVLQSVLNDNITSCPSPAKKKTLNPYLYRDPAIVCEYSVFLLFFLSHPSSSDPLHLVILPWQQGLDFK